MDSHNIAFVILGVIIACMSVMTVATKSIMRSATYLFFTLLGTAGLYFLLGYTFLGAVQIMVYAGGIIVLYVFAILLTRGVKDRLTENTKSKIIASAVLSFAGLGLFLFAFLSYQFKAEILQAPNESVLPMQTIGNALLSSDKGGFLLPFEVVSLLLLACIVGGVVIARKR